MEMFYGPAGIRSVSAAYTGTNIWFYVAGCFRPYVGRIAIINGCGST
jgi:hypothetical protein